MRVIFTFLGRSCLAELILLFLALVLVKHKGTNLEAAIEDDVKEGIFLFIVSILVSDGLTLHDDYFLGLHMPDSQTVHHLIDKLAKLSVTLSDVWLLKVWIYQVFESPVFEAPQKAFTHVQSQRYHVD